jgi:hypothetical protein
MRRRPTTAADGARASDGAPPLISVLDGLEEDVMEPQAQRLLLAMTRVPGSSKACASRGDEAMFAALQAYYAIAEQAARAAGGRFVKAIASCSPFHSTGRTPPWRAFANCRSAALPYGASSMSAATYK